MRERRFFIISSYLMMVAAVAALAITDNVPLSVAAAVGAVIVAALCLENTRWQIAERTGLYVALCSIVLGAAVWVYGSQFFGWHSDGMRQQFITSALVWLTLLKLIQRKTDRDWIFLYVLSFFQLLFAVGSRFDANVFGLFVGYTIAGLCAATSREIKQTGESFLANSRSASLSPKKVVGRVKPADNFDSLDVPRKDFAVVPNGRLLAISLGVFLLVVVIALPIFLFAPRFTRSASARTRGGSGNTIGYSDRVTLGNIGRLQQSNEVVMRVRIENLPPEFNQGLRWRGSAFDTFDGMTWSRQRETRVPVETTENGLYKVSTTRDTRRLVRQTFYIEPTATSILFAAPRVIAVEGSLPFVLVDSESGLQSRRHTESRLTYRAYSEIETFNLEQLNLSFGASRLNRERITDAANGNASALAASVADYENQKIEVNPMARYTTLPANFDARITRLARRVVADAGAKTFYEQSRAIEHYLRDENNFRYSLEMTATGDNPLSDFLFRTRTGHCEYFASAMALMLRAQGIPARVVTGYMSGEFNAAADAYIVRQNNAHAWTEIYLPGVKQWVTFDPTPAANPANQNGSGDSWLAGLAKYGEAAEMMWLQYVVAYGKQEQIWLARNVRSILREQVLGLAARSQNLSAEARNWYQSLSVEQASSEALTENRKPVIALIALGVVLGGLAFYWHRRRRTFREVKKNLAGNGRSSVEFYEQMTAVLQSSGYKRERARTPREFAAQVALPEVARLTEVFEQTRYGSRELSSSQRREVESLIANLQTSIQAKSEAATTSHVNKEL